MLIGVILPDEHPWRSQADSQGVVTFDGQVPELTKASRTPLELLLIDLALLDPDSLPDIRRYRVARPGTRIVVSFPCDTRPGNQILASCVGLGVYDILNRDTPLSDALAVVRCYADVAQWHSSPEETTAAARKWPFWRNRKTGPEKKNRNEKDESAKQAQSTRLAGVVKSKRSNGETAENKFGKPKDGTTTPFFPVPLDFASLDEDTGAAFYPSIRELCEAKPSAVLVSCGRKDLTETIKTLRREYSMSAVPIVVVGRSDNSDCYNAGANECLENLDEGAVQRIQAMATRMRELWTKAIKDDLTGLYEREFLDHYLAELMQRYTETGVPFSIMMADLDHFKAVNDTYSHQAGDAVLKEFANFLSARARETDVVSRFGGEEFMVVFPGTEDARSMADRLCLEWAARDVTLPGGEKIQCTFSAGIALLGKDADDVEGLVGAADKAMYQAKGAGRNRVVGSGEVVEIKVVNTTPRPAHFPPAKVINSQKPIQPNQVKILTEERRWQSVISKPDISRVLSKLKPKRKGEIPNLVAIWSPSSTGKTFIAVNLAVAYSNKGYKTVLVSNDAAKHWFSLCNEVPALSNSYKGLRPSEVPGLVVLAKVNANDYRKLSELADVVVIDGQKDTITYAGQIILVVNIACLDEISNQMDRMDLDWNKVWVIANGVPFNEMTRVEFAIKLKVDYTVPYNIKHGNLVNTMPGSRITEIFKRIAIINT